MGEEEYNWALKNNFQLDKTAAQLFDEAWPIVQATQTQMIDLARKIGAAAQLEAAGRRPGRRARRLRRALEGLSEVRRRDDLVVSRRRVPARRLRAQDRHLRRAGRLQARSRRDAAAARSVDRRRRVLPGAAVQEHRRRPLLRHADRTTTARRCKATTARRSPTSPRTKAFPATTGTTR